jgi:GDPmannose 4,6-dehydratase
MAEDCYEVMKILSIDEAKKFATNKPVVIITGVTGQDGSFMADYLLGFTDYEVFGGARRLSVFNHKNLEHLKGHPRFHLINFDLTDAHSISQTISQLQPLYFINFAAQSFVKSSWDFPAQTWETNTTSLIHILEAIRLHRPQCRFYNAGSSEEFGDVVYSPQDESHPIRPRSPYGASKAAARQIVKVYRESYGLYAVQGWCT